MHNNITLNKVSRVQYRLDGGAWLPAATFDTYTATLDLNIGPLSAGYHEIEIRTIDDATGITSAVFRGNTTQSTATLHQGINGFAWNDRDGDGTWDAGEEGLADQSMRLLDTSLAPVLDVTTIEPDDYAEGALLAQVTSLATLSAIGSEVVNSSVTGRARSTATTGMRVFNHLLSGGWNSTWSNSTRRLRIDVTDPMRTVSIDALSVSSAARGRLEIYNASGNLLGTYITANLASVVFETMTASRPSSDIAYANYEPHACSTQCSPTRTDYWRLPRSSLNNSIPRTTKPSPTIQCRCGWVSLPFLLTFLRRSTESIGLRRRKIFRVKIGGLSQENEKGRQVGQLDLASQKCRLYPARCDGSAVKKRNLHQPCALAPRVRSLTDFLQQRSLVRLARTSR